MCGHYRAASSQVVCCLYKCRCLLTQVIILNDLAKEMHAFSVLFHSKCTPLHVTQWAFKLQTGRILSPHLNHTSAQRCRLVEVDLPAKAITQQMPSADSQSSQMASLSGSGKECDFFFFFSPRPPPGHQWQVRKPSVATSHAKGHVRQRINPAGL